MKRIIVGLQVLWIFFPFSIFANLPSIAFFYGSKPPLQQLRPFDVAVVDPNASVDPRQYNTQTSQLFAYVSVGELNARAPYAKQFQEKWLIGNNTIWKTKVIDQSSPQWQQFFIEKVITPLWTKGYRGFFFDTLDSYQLAAHDQQSRERQVAGIIALIKLVKNRYPTAQLILNRGFELLPAVHKQVYAVAAESLFSSWDERQKKYEPVTETNRANLLVELQKVQQMGLPVVVIDYVDPSNRIKALEVAKQISQFKMIPWVSDGHLETLGVGQVMLVPRKVWVFYSEDKNETVFNPPPFYLLGMPLEYLGYTPEFHDVEQTLPARLDPNEYAGVIYWAYSSDFSRQQHLFTWLLQQKKQHIPIVFMENLAFALQPKFLAAFGLDLDQRSASSDPHLSISQQNKSIVGFESQPLLNFHDFLPLRTQAGDVLLQIVNAKGQKEDAIAVTEWGGYALEPYVITLLPNSLVRWVVNPVEWLRLALHRDAFPAPDVTTENGRRMMMVHIDGDGFASKAELPKNIYAGAELKTEILDRYQIPTTVSVITGDIAPNGLYPNLSTQLITLAQNIFKLPWVEIASHTFSHPFDWIEMQRYQINGKYNLPIKNYHYNIEQEVMGSVDYIDKVLAPPHKACKILFWSGSANPDVKTMKLVCDNHLYNMNGGNTSITNSNNTWAMIYPMGLTKDNYFQVFSPMTNENIYTRQWTGPYYGFQRAIETMQLTESPHRFKPIDIYYHFYSASKRASLLALNKVYQWALAQPVINLFESEFIPKVLDFYQLTISRSIDGGWQIDTHGELREVRMPVNLGYPDLQRSLNLVGYNIYDNQYYLHLGPAPRSQIYFRQQPLTIPYLVAANGMVTYFKRIGTRIDMRLRGHQPLQFEVANMTDCQLRQGKKILSGQAEINKTIRFMLNDKDSDAIQIQC